MPPLRAREHAATIGSLRDSAASAVTEVADELSVAFDNLPASEARTATRFTEVRLGTAAPSAEVIALTRMGFELTSVNHNGFNSEACSCYDFDAFYASTDAFNPLDLDATEQAAFDEWLGDGGAVVGRGVSGHPFNTGAELLDVGIVAFG